MKKETDIPVPAQELYLAPHIQATKKIADTSGLPFFILSGKYGLLAGADLVSNYDYYLEASAVESLASMMAEQIKDRGITEIDFYFEDKESWKPYKDAMTGASLKAGIVCDLKTL